MKLMSETPVKANAINYNMEEHALKKLIII